MPALAALPLIGPPGIRWVPNAFGRVRAVGTHTASHWPAVLPPLATQMFPIWDG